MSLDERKQKILGAVVRDYVETVRPVGSEELAARYAWGVKSATIRNEMADLAEMGYLRQPHTSAGRIPSDRGYRFYVDHLLIGSAPIPFPNDAGVSGLGLDYLLRRTCALLTRHTSYTSVATPPRLTDTRISRVLLSAAGEGRLLLVALLSAGQVENRLLSGFAKTTPAQIVSLGNALQQTFADRLLRDVIDEDAAIMSAPPELTARMRGWAQTLTQALREMLQSASEEDSTFLEGATDLFRQPEFRDGAKLEGLLDTLQKRTLVFQTLSRALLGPEVAVVIGAENHVAAMHECSVVSAPYFVGASERGTIGVVGPTRMNYDRAIPAVEFFARSLTQTLTYLGRS